MEKVKRENSAELTKRNKRIIIVFTAVFLGIILLFGAVLGIVALVRNSRAYLSYRGVTIGEGVTNYLAMMAKYEYMSSLTAAGIGNDDSDYFWQREAEDGKTYGDLLKIESDAYIKRVLVGSYFFDKNASLTKADKQNIKDSVDAIINNYPDRESFDRAAAKRGFTLSDLERGAELIYKYNLARTVIFGYDGEALKGGSFDAELDEFYDRYSYVKLLFIRTANVTSDEKSAALEKIERIRYLISGSDDEIMGTETFDYYIGEFESDERNRKDGYYLSPTSDHTSALNEAYPEVVKASLSAKENTYTEVNTFDGVCFIYKGKLPTRGYLYPSSDTFFTDFYSQAAGYIYFKEITAASDDVEIEEEYLAVDPILIPYDHKLVIRF